MKSSIHKLTKLTIDIYNKKVSLMPEEAKLFQLNTYSRLILLNIMKGHYSGKYLSAEEIINNINNIYIKIQLNLACLFANSRRKNSFAKQILQVSRVPSFLQQFLLQMDPWIVPP